MVFRIVFILYTPMEGLENDRPIRNTRMIFYPIGLLCHYYFVMTQNHVKIFL